MPDLGEPAGNDADGYIVFSRLTLGPYGTDCHALFLCCVLMKHVSFCLYRFVRVGWKTVRKFELGMMVVHVHKAMNGK